MSPTAQPRDATQPALSPATAPTWLLPVAILLVLLAVMHGGDHAAAVLRYERAAVLSGEAWRLLTGHLVHADRSHLLWNVLGLVARLRALCRRVLAAANGSR